MDAVRLNEIELRGGRLNGERYLVNQEQTIWVVSLPVEQTYAIGQVVVTPPPVETLTYVFDGKRDAEGRLLFELATVEVVDRLVD